MDQVEMRESFPILDKVRGKREELGLEALDVDLLRAQAGSQDPLVAGKAQRQLLAKWDLAPKQDARAAESINIVEQLARFSKEEQKLMFGNLVAIQLTEGCNGNCPFCMFGTKSGVSAKYSFESLQAMLRENGDMMADHPFVFYWDSDPFDWRDGEHSFVDVFKLYRDVLPMNSHYVSTAMPRGGEEDFIKFMKYLAITRREAIDENAWKLPVRLSLTQQNIQRVEATLEQLTAELLEEGFTPEDVQDLYKTDLYTVKRFDNYLLPIGPYIAKADDLKDTFSTACRDGVILTPKSSQAIMITAATIYEPSGQKNIDLVSGQVEQQVPRKIRDEFYTIWTVKDKPLISLEERVNGRRVMIPTIQTAVGEPLNLPDMVEDISLKLGREVAAVTRLIGNVSRVAGLQLDSPSPTEEKMTYLRMSAEAFRQRKEYFAQLLVSAQNIFEEPQLDEDARERISYYLLLATVHVAKMEFLTNEIEKETPMDIIGFMAGVLADIGRDQIHTLPKVMEFLLQAGRHGFSIDETEATLRLYKEEIDAAR